MRKQLSVTLACFLLASVSASAQGWKTYEEAAQGKAYEKSDCVTLLDSTLVSVQPTGQGSFAVCKVIKVQTPKGAVSNRIIKYDYDPLTAHAEFKRVTVYRADGKVENLDVTKTCDYAAPARAIYWGARQIMLEVGALQPGDIVDYEIAKKGFTYALLAATQEDDSKFIPPMRGQFYDIVPFWSSHPTVRKVYKVVVPMEKEMQFQFYQGECASSMRYEDGRKAYTFAMNDMMPFGREPNMVDLFDAAPKLMMSSTPQWQDKSLWFNKVNEDYGSFAPLPEAQKKVDELIKGKKTEMEKIAVLTHWVADNIRYAGISPELGLSETQQTLVLNGLRGQVMLQVDGQLKTGRDIILMAMLGAEEFGFATSALIVLGCVMMRKCHQNTCPVGVATQNEELRKRFRGRSEYLVNFFTFLAQEVREYLAEIGVERLDDIIGRTDLIVRKPDDGIRKHQLISFDKLLARVDNEAAIRHVTDQQHGIDHVKDVEMLHAAAEAVENQKEISLEYTIANTDRACGAMLSGVIAAKYGEKGLPEHTLNVKFKGSAGQSFGAFLVPGVNFKLEGEANDYLGKGLSGGRIAVLPPVRSNFEAEKNTIAGNTLLYGATSGEVYINGRAGERFAVRNSGATAVVEGVGDHCCEYMTGGRVVVLGQTGRNFAAGMSGGVAYVWNRDGNFDYFCNMEMVELSLIEEASYRKELHELICQHYLYTGSKLARTMLDDWPRYADQFIQVVPIEYKKVLQEEQMQKLQQKIAEMQRDY